MDSLHQLLKQSARVCIVSVAVLSAPPLGAQRARALSLQEVVERALAVHPDMAIAAAAVEIERGAVIEARHPFDARPSATLTNTRTALGASDLAQASGLPAALNSEANVSLSKLFRSGVRIESGLGVARASPNGLSAPTLNELVTRATVTVPTLRGRWGGLLAALERSAGEDYRAAESGLRAAASVTVLRAALAYWAYLATYHRVEVERGAAERSARTVEEVIVLIRADERPRSDLDLVTANAAAKRAARIEAERRIERARTELALAIGVGRDETAALAAPGTEFPDLEAPGDLQVAALVGEATANRHDLASARRRREAARLLRDGVASQHQARMDVVLNVDYANQIGGRSLDRLIQPLSTGARGTNVSLGLSFEPSGVDSAIRGELIAAGGAYSRATIESENLARVIALEVADAASAVSSSQLQSDSTREAVSHSRLALATVQRNFDLGTATVFDRILAEDAVTNAELSDLDAKLQYAIALANLQFARGTLVDVQADRLRADWQRLMRVSAPDPK